MKWNKLKVEDFADVVGGGTPSTSNASLWDGDIPWITPKDLSGYEARFIERGERYITEEGLRKSSAQMLPTGAVLLSTRAPVGYVAIAENPLCTNQGFKSLIPKPETASNEFIYYLLKQNRSFLESQSSGSTYKELNGGRLKQLLFPIPPIQIQHRIASILSAYDDLIENNLRRIKLLEESAGLLYKEWFVRLRFPGYEHIRIIDGVPEGWEKKKLGEVIELKYGKSLKEPDRIEGPYPVYGSSGVIGTHDRFLVKGPGIIVGRKGNAGTVFWSDTDFFPIDTVYYIDTTQSGYFIFQNLQHQNFQSSHGAVPGLNREYAYSLSIFLPTKLLLNEFEEAVSPLYGQLFKLKTMNEKLRQARDLLLPKLMSGEVEV